MDFVKHIERTVATDAEADWVFVTDQLNIHQSEGLVKLVAKACGIAEETLGKERQERGAEVPEEPEGVSGRAGAIAFALSTLRSTARG